VFEELYIETGPCRSVKLRFQFSRTLIGADEEIAIQTLKPTIDHFVVDDAFDLIDRQGMTLGRLPSTLAPMQVLEFVITLVEYRGEMRCGADGFTAADRPSSSTNTFSLIELDNTRSSDRRFRANHADIARDVSFERVTGWRLNHPIQADCVCPELIIFSPQNV
jgi:hypothetical protein